MHAPEGREHYLGYDAIPGYTDMHLAFGIDHGCSVLMS